MSEVIEARNIKLNVDASDWRDSMIKSGQLLVDSDSTGYFLPLITTLLP